MAIRAGSRPGGVPQFLAQPSALQADFFTTFSESPPFVRGPGRAALAVIIGLQQFSGWVPQSPYAQTADASTVVDSTVVVPLTVVVDEPNWAPSPPALTAPQFSSDPVPQRARRVQVQSEFALAGPSAPLFSSNDLSVPDKPTARPQPFPGFVSNVTTLLVTFTQPPASVAKPRSAAQQRFAELPLLVTSAATPTTTNWMFQPFVVSFVRPLSAAQQQFSGLPPQPITDAATYIAASMADSLIVVEHRIIVDDVFWSPFAPTTVATASTWRHQQDPIRFVKPIPASRQPFVGGWPPRPTTFAASTTAWIHGQPPVKHIKPFPASQQRFSGFQPIGTIVTTGVPGYSGPSASSLKKHRKFRAPPISITISYGLAIADTPSNFWATQWQTAFRKRFPVTQQPFSGYSPRKPVLIIGAPSSGTRSSSMVKNRRFRTPPTSITTAYQGPQFSQTPIEAWMFQQPVRFAKRMPVAPLPFSSFAPRGTIIAVNTLGWAHQQPVALRKRVSPAQQRFGDFTPLGAITAPVTVGQYFQQPTVFGKRFPVGLQRFGDFQPLGAVISVTPQGWMFQQPAVTGKPFPASLQRFGDFQPLDTIVVVTPQGWMFQQPERLIKPFAAALQRFADFAPLDTIFVPTPDFQLAYAEPPVRFVKPLSPTLQQFGAFQPRDAIFSVTQQGWFGQAPVRLIKPYPVILQQFSTIVLRPYPSTVIGVPTGEGLKNEVLRVTWLMGSSVRIVYLKNEIIRITDLEG